MVGQDIYDCDDNHSKVNTDILFLIDKVKIIKDKIKKTPWFRFGTLIKLRRELRDLDKESDEIGERLKKLHAQKMNPIQIVKRQ